jgi:flagellar motor protein MotB
MMPRTHLAAIVSRTLWVGLAAAALCIAPTGCTQNPYLGQPTTTSWQQQQMPQYNAQLADLQRRVQHLDDNNRQLHTQLAQAEQSAQVYRDELGLVRQQLADATRQMQQSQLAERDAQTRVDAIRASTQFRGNATLQANTSLRRLADPLKGAGFAVESDGDVLRVRIPSDQLFQPATAQLIPQATTTLDAIAGQIRQHFPRQKIGIEGHTDSSPQLGGVYSSAHQLSSAQSNAVLEHLTRRSGLAEQQFLTTAQGANFPVGDNNSAAGRASNRRLEFVIYPETF